MASTITANYYTILNRKNLEHVSYRTTTTSSALQSSQCSSSILPGLRLKEQKQNVRSVNWRKCVNASLSTEESDVSAEPQKSSAAEYISILKEAAQTKKVSGQQVSTALTALEKLRLEPAGFLETLGGTSSPGNTWKLVFVANGKKKGDDAGGSYFPVTAVQRFDATAMEIENGVFLGPLGSLTFKGPMGWSGKRLSFLFDTLSIRLGSLGPFKFNIGKKEDVGRVPGVGKVGKEDPFFIWVYADDDIVAARGRGGGLAFWERCAQIV